jgi:hypothetical protein
MARSREVATVVLSKFTPERAATRRSEAGEALAEVALIAAGAATRGVRVVRVVRVVREVREVEDAGWSGMVKEGERVYPKSGDAARSMRAHGSK